MLIDDAARIALGVAVYRLRRLEMANIAGAAAICVALALPPAECVLRLGFAFGLNVLVYLNNDYLDLATDLRAPGRDDAKTRFLRDHRAAGLTAQVGLLIVLLGLCAFDPGLVVPLVLGGGVCWAYSARLKAMPYADVAAMVVWGVAMPLCGSPVDSALGWALAGWLGLFSGVFEAVQVIRDHEDDAAAGVRTTAVVLGVTRTFLLVRLMLAASAVYGALVVSPWLAVLPAAAMGIPLDRARVTRTWNHLRLVLGVAFLGAISWVVWFGATDGVLVQVARDMSLGTSTSP
ncbi:MAG TPA: UbiA family prenyltransferase [Nannocystis sp.]|jgi:4-hydroxybenzoate polyprenyltransferase